MILGIILFPKIKLGKIALSTYWVCVLLGAAAMLIFGRVGIKSVASALTSDTAINPIKILCLFISMTVLSIFLDEMGLFSYLANETLKKAGHSQFRIFFYLYAIVSVLTVFTSNDIIILTFTPFIAFFTKNAKIDPLPYLIAEFVAANTWSLTLIIGNPTNIYLATSYGVGFAEYFRVMFLPTLAAGTAAFLVLLLIFGKSFKTPISPEIKEQHIKDKTLLTVGVAHLAVCTVMLAVGPYFNIDMWLVSLFAVVSLFIWVLGISAVRKRKPSELIRCLKRAPWELIPFVLSMFVMIIALSECGATAKLGGLIGEKQTVFRYGFASFLSSNVINNIPMSVLFSSVTGSLSGAVRRAAIFGTVVGSNIGAFLTPTGALAGIMWSSLLRARGIKLSYGSFLKYGALVSIPTISAALAVLSAVL